MQYIKAVTQGGSVMEVVVLVVIAWIAVIVAFEGRTSAS